MAVNSEQWRQYVSALCVLFVAVFVGLPTWWRTTEVYRCSLPYQEIDQLARQQVPPTVVFQISIAVLGRAEKAEEEEFSALLQRELTRERLSSGSTQLELSFTVTFLRLGYEDKTKLMEVLESGARDEFSALAERILPPSKLGHYTIFLVRGGGGGGGGGGFVSPYRHAVVHVGNDLPSALPVVVRLVRTVYGSSQTIEKALRIATGNQQADVESMRQLRATQGYQISFTLLNPDPSLLQAQWNIEEATQDILVPFLKHPGIASLGNFTVSSQEFYYTDTKLRPKKGERGYHVTPASLPPMISSVEAKLGSHVSQLPSLNFLVYIPRGEESPLLIKDGSSSTDAFLVPQWGGVVIFNPPELSEEGETFVPMEQLMPVFVKQLRMLLGLPSDQVVEMEEFVFAHGRLGLSEWQVDQLLVAKMIESVSMATTSLISLVGLLDKVKNMVISDHIQEQVVSSLDAVRECYRLAGEGELEVAYSAAKGAMLAAETAFFDPSILELLYFPDDQKFAIYIPLFLPISIPILLSSITALKWALPFLQQSKEILL